MVGRPDAWRSASASARSEQTSANARAEVASASASSTAGRRPRDAWPARIASAAGGRRAAGRAGARRRALAARRQPGEQRLGRLDMSAIAGQRLGEVVRAILAAGSACFGQALLGEFGCSPAPLVAPIASSSRSH
jgi:hypothetical protein